jgi:hypothetical protein
MSVADVYDAQVNILKTIRMEILDKVNNVLDKPEAQKMKNFLLKINMAEEIIMLGDDGRHLERGAIELLRIQAILASFFASKDIVERLDEISQLSMKSFREPETFMFNLSKKDVGMFEALGEFGFENDQYNEQDLSEDFLPFIDQNTQIGQYTASEVIEWSIS